MSDLKESIYVGNAKKVGNDGFSIELNLNQLKAFLQSEEAKEHIRKFNTKTGEQSTIKLVAWPLKEPQQYRTHSVKIDTWKPTQPAQAAPTPQPVNEPTSQTDALPF